MIKKVIIIISLMLTSLYIPNAISDSQPFSSTLVKSIDDYDILPFASHIVDKRVYESQVIVDGHLPIIISLSMTSTKVLKNDSVKELISKSTFTKEKLGDYTFSIEVLVNESYEREVMTYKNTTTKDKNGTSSTISKVDKIILVKDYRWVWKSIDNIKDLTLDKNGFLVFDIKVMTKASTHTWSMDMVPTITLDSKNYVLTQYAWWNASWGYCKKIVIDHTKVVKNLYNYPILYVNRSDSFAAHARADGYDFRFVNYDNSSRFHYELESYVSATGNITAWVNVTNISSQSDTKLWVYYGNAAANTRPVDERYTWDSHYIFVTHMNDSTTSKVFDSTRNALFTGTKTDGANQPIVTPGKFGNCQNFSDDDIAFATGTNLNVGTLDYSCEMWLRPHSVAALAQTWFRYQDGVNKFYWYMFGGVNNYEYIKWGGTVTEAMASTNFIVNNWYYMAYVADRDTSNYIYQNGRSDPLTTNTGDGNANNVQLNIVFQFGRNAPATSQYYGRADEVRFSNIARNASWVNTTWKCLYYPNAFLTTLDEIGLPIVPSYPPNISYMFPLNNSIDVCPCDSYMCITPFHSNGTLFSLYVYINSSYDVNYSIEITYYNITNNTYCYCLGCNMTMRFNTTYHWYVFLFNGDNKSINYTSDVYTFTTKASPPCLSSTPGTGGGGYGYILYDPAIGLIGLIGVIGFIGILGYLRKNKKENE